MAEKHSDYELQARAIYSLIVAGKSAKFGMPFDIIRRLSKEKGSLRFWLEMARTGNYRKLTKALPALAESGVNLRTCGPEELERLHGWGPKSARFFIIWTRPESRYAALDVHVLRWMRKRGYDAPKSTPQNPKKYARLEKALLEEADRRGMTPRELDSMIWDAAQKGGGG